MRKKLLYTAVLALFLTSCSPDDDGIHQIHIEAEDITYHAEDTLPSSREECDDISGYFEDYGTLAVPDSISGIVFLGKENDRYIYTFPDNKDLAVQLYNEYGALIQSDGFTLEEYEENYIIKYEGESVAFMGTGYNTEHDYIMLIAFYANE
ncbi:MAG: hypothetical protein HDQ96_05740 [Lachnospiraceae bacterium]|nr:hypothetical protein [Lachnospiraceae bacterium]